MAWLKIYGWEQETYPEFYQKTIGLSDAQIYIRKFAKHFEVNEPFVPYSKKRKGGTYWHGSQKITLPVITNLGTVIHEFAHHLADQTNGKRNGHNKLFKKSLKKVYTFAKKRNYLNK